MMILVIVNNSQTVQTYNGLNWSKEKLTLHWCSYLQSSTVIERVNKCKNHKVFRPAKAKHPEWQQHYLVVGSRELGRQLGPQLIQLLSEDRLLLLQWGALLLELQLQLLQRHTTHTHTGWWIKHQGIHQQVSEWQITGHYIANKHANKDDCQRGGSIDFVLECFFLYFFIIYTKLLSLYKHR